MVGPLVWKNSKTGAKEYRPGGFLREGDDRDIFVTTYEIEVVGPMKIKSLYTALHDNLFNEGWVDPKSGDDKFESLYWERVLDNNMKEHHMWWRMVKYTHQRGPEKGFSRWAMKIDFQTLAVNPTEIAYKGAKKKVDSADLIIRVWFWVQWDFENKFEKSMGNTLKTMFRRELFKDELENEFDNCKAEAEKLRRYLKTFLDLEDIGEQPTLFEEHRGYQDQFSP